MLLDSFVGIDEAFKNLQAAIIEQAVFDYRAALKNGEKGKARVLERFFRSEWGQELSRDNGDEIIKRVREEAKAYEKNTRSIARKNRKS